MKYKTDNLSYKIGFGLLQTKGTCVVTNKLSILFSFLVIPHFFIYVTHPYALLGYSH